MYLVNMDDVTTHVRVPTVTKVNVDMFAGDLNIHNVQAGDISIELIN